MTSLRALVPGFGTGLLFGIGLLLSGMTDPRRVLAFLDFFGAWDPSLALVMIGAILAHAPALVWTRRLHAPLLGPAFAQPPRFPIDSRLVGGAVLFGLGWGLVGYCPGPLVVAAATLNADTGLVLCGVAAGIMVHRLYAHARVAVETNPTPAAR